MVTYGVSTSLPVSPGTSTPPPLAPILDLARVEKAPGTTIIFIPGYTLKSLTQKADQHWKWSPFFYIVALHKDVE